MNRRRAIIGPILLVLILIIGVAILRNIGDVPLPTATARPPAEPASIYLGALDDGSSVVGLVVGQVRARAAVCSLDDTRWRALTRWLDQGTVGTAGGKTTITAQNTDTASGQFRLLVQADSVTLPDILSGVYTTPDGAAHPFKTRRLPDGVREGIYRLADARLPDGKDSALLIVILTRVADTGEGDMCGMLVQNDQPISRVVLKDIWQGGFTNFVLVDIRDKDNKASLMMAPGILGRIDSIALPTPTSTP